MEIGKDQLNLLLYNFCFRIILEHFYHHIYLLTYLIKTDFLTIGVIGKVLAVGDLGELTSTPGPLYVLVNGRARPAAAFGD